VSCVLDDSKLSRDRLLLVLLSIEVPGRFTKLKVVMTPPPIFVVGTLYIYPLV